MQIGRGMGRDEDLDVSQPHVHGFWLDLEAFSRRANSFNHGCCVLLHYCGLWLSGGGFVVVQQGTCKPLTGRQQGKRARRGLIQRLRQLGVEDQGMNVECYEVRTFE